TASKTDRQSPVKTFAGNWSTLDNNGINGWDPRTLLLSEKDTAACLQFAENHMDKTPQKKVKMLQIISPCLIFGHQYSHFLQYLLLFT
uniref:Uncharacterized protein n=1 Tax=Haplochromis burtoni TaxID=8153 RepID=A0A3Q2VBP2_HAPBU